jgi:hypothetical protein
VVIILRVHPEEGLSGACAQVSAILLFAGECGLMVCLMKQTYGRSETWGQIPAPIKAAGIAKAARSLSQLYR